jgi:chromate transporter
MESPLAPSRPGTAQLFSVFLKIGLLSFGGPAAQIALMHRVLVEERGWLTEDEYLRALSFCMLLPGPEAMQLATYAGWKLRGTPGGLIAGLLFVGPGALVILAFAVLYAAYGTAPAAQALLLGVKAAVVAIVIDALVRLGKRALRGRSDLVLALVGFLALFFLMLPFPLLIAFAALWGLLAARGQGGAAPPATRPALGATLRTVSVWSALWLLPLAALVWAGPDLLARMAAYFAALALFSFGGAYAALGWMTQTLVADYGWITQGQMIDALGLAETTPGPLILVTQFVGYLAGHNAGGLMLGLGGAAVALWMTFIPCFLYIFAGAPWLEHVTSRPALRGALAAISAAVVGVIASISAWFALHVLFARVDSLPLGPLSLPLPELGSFQPMAALLALLAGVLILWWRWPLPLVLLICALCGWAVSLA